MKKSTLLVVVLLLAFTPLLNAQVGIGTTNPKALLHIVAPPGTSPEESGIILPKVSALPSTNLDGKKGMFLYLDSNDIAEGIYFYNGEKWKKNDNAWRLGGNTVTNADYIGANNNTDLNFKIANKQRLKIGASGDLVYHDANNTERLNIDNNGDFTLNNNNNNRLISITNAGTFLFKNNNNNSLFEMTQDGNFTLANASNERLLEIKNNGVITLPHTTIDNIKSDDKSIVTKEYVDTNLASGGGSLEKITVGPKTSYRLKGSNHGALGHGAIDLSTSYFNPTNHGAKGDFAFATGKGTIASGEESFAAGNGAKASGARAFALGNGAKASGNQSFATGNSTTASGDQSFATGNGTTASGGQSFAIGTSTNAKSYSEVALGHFNTNLTAASTNGVNTSDRVLSVGIGTGTGARADGLEIFKDGTIYADELEVSEITDDQQLVTKKYVDTNLAISSGGGVLEKITEGNRYGWRINAEANAANHGNIGSQAVDLSFSSLPSDYHGATGGSSFAVGWHTRASGNFSFAFGDRSLASGHYSFAGGESSQALHKYAVAFGEQTRASCVAETAIGMFNSIHEPVNANFTSPDIKDRVFSIGIGTSYINRKAALEVFYNGKIYANELELDEINDPKQLVIKEYVDDQVSNAENSVTVESSSTSINIQSDKRRETFIMTGGTPVIDTISVPAEDSLVDGKIITIIRPDGGNDIRLNQGGNIELLYDDVKLSNNINNNNSIDYKSSITLVYSAEQDKWYVLSAY